MYKLFDTAKEKPHPAPQKFHSLMVKGLVYNNAQVTCLVALPVTKRSHPNKRWWGGMTDIHEGVKYVYIPFYNNPFLKLIGFKLYGFFYTLIWAFRTKGEKAMVCDVLNAHASGSTKACKLLGIKAAGIVTDIPGLMVGTNKDSFFRSLIIKENLINIGRLTHLIPLTEAMCDIINPKRKIPFVVIEGLVDSQMKDKNPTPYLDGKRHITYTGTLEARYGIRMMLEAFMLLKQKDVVLDVFGKGPMGKEMASYMEKDSRIKYHGIVAISEAVAAQRSSYLLINPRPTNEEFTKYSFPSKNMEYMVTGVPLLTAVLPGMPEEYHPFVFLFEDETAEGLFSKMNEILELPEENVRGLGMRAKAFVMNNKNNIIQARKVIELINR